MHFYVQVDREISERAGAANMFQLVSIEDENGKNYIRYFDQGFHYCSLDDVKSQLAEHLNTDINLVSFEEIT